MSKRARYREVPSTHLNPASPEHLGWRTLSGSGIRWMPFEMQPGMRLQGHRHQRALLCLVASGEFEEDDGQAQIVCSAGTIRLSKPGSAHQLVTGNNSVKGRLIELPEAWGFGDRRFWASPLAHRFTQGGRFEETVDALHHLLDEDPRVPRLGIQLAVRKLLAGIAYPESTQPVWQDRVIAYIDREFLSHRLPQVLAEEAGLHRTHFARQFFRVFGTSVSETIRIRKLDFAALLLRDTGEEIASIAFESGFADQSHLTRTFKSYFGLTPRAYRLQFKANQA